MRFVDVIARKRDGAALSREEIDYFVAGAAAGSLPDYQLSALLMAIVLRGMTADETSWLTEAMVQSGSRVDLSDVPGNKVGKHSTGGVGDKVSIALVPLVAACGLVVPKMSGRGLGHTGGTVDKLESIAGYRVQLPIAEFKAVLRDVGCSIVAQTTDLAPADKKLYALRDVTATVESLPLIASSVMSKKLAEGASALVLDVKCGRGAFMKDATSARALAASMVTIGTSAGVRTEALVTAMDTPLGRAVGNAIEIDECVRLLRGEGPPELTELTVVLATRMVAAGGGHDDAAAHAVVSRALQSGAGLETLRRMIERHGGEPRVVDDPTRFLPRAMHHTTVRAERAGCVARLDAGAIGRAAVVLGAGRDRVGADIDHAAGIVVLAPPGARVAEGDAVLELRSNDTGRLEAARPLAVSAVGIGEEPPPSPLVLDTIR
jgi:pyrimidine-nucleoside phosphorylase